MVNHISLKTVSPIGGDRQEPPWELCYPGPAKIFFRNCKFPIDFCLWVCYILFVPTRKGVTKMGIPKGMKLTDTPKDRTLKIRFDAETEAKLEALTSATGKTKAQVVRDGIDLQYAELEK